MTWQDTFYTREPVVSFFCLPPLFNFIRGYFRSNESVFAETLRKHQKTCCNFIRIYNVKNMANLDQQLVNAAAEGNLTTVELLVSHGANINYIDPWGNCAVFSAAWEGNIKALDLYYSLGAVIELEDNNPLCNAAFNGQIESVKWLIEKGADANFSFTKTGENALHYTICKTSEIDERAEIVKLLVDAGTDVNKKTNKGATTLCFMRDAFLKGETPLHRAAAYGNESIIRLLIAAGADSSVKDANGDSPISWGSWHLRDSNVLRLLLYGDVPGIR